MSYQQYQCSICGKGGHRASNCKELGIPPDGFYKPSSGRHYHDDNEEEKININDLLYNYKKWLYKVLKLSQIKHQTINPSLS
jgi:hypothetical protein